MVSGGRVLRIKARRGAGGGNSSDRSVARVWEADGKLRVNGTHAVLCQGETPPIYTSTRDVRRYKLIYPLKQEMSQCQDKH
ncbi:hypothetical protein BaRGS_00031434 [Batillaria attramentaria]|uniref:Uncharacterized protein n=1 Tax=Batillaria attramentaria TaxID=370345 RepID=A0ABD0JQ93_9CAEN